MACACEVCLGNSPNPVAGKFSIDSLLPIAKFRRCNVLDSTWRYVFCAEGTDWQCGRPRPNRVVGCILRAALAHRAVPVDLRLFARCPFVTGVGEFSAYLLPVGATTFMSILKFLLILNKYRAIKLTVAVRRYGAPMVNKAGYLRN